jgi:hypothetical protein
MENSQLEKFNFSDLVVYPGFDGDAMLGEDPGL